MSGTARNSENAGLGSGSDAGSIDIQRVSDQETDEDIHKSQQQQDLIESIFKNLKELVPRGHPEAAELDKNRSVTENLHTLKSLTDELKNYGRLAARTTDTAVASLAQTDGSYWTSITQILSSLLGLIGPVYSMTWAFFTRRPLFNQVTVSYNTLVRGNTLGVHLDVISRLNGPVLQNRVPLKLRETQTDEESQVTIIFCPIVSRSGTDIKAALQDIPGDKVAILVVMHHLHTPTAFPPPKPNSRAQLGVNIFFHETQGLLCCRENDVAINEMRMRLHEIGSA